MNQKSKKTDSKRFCVRTTENNTPTVCAVAVRFRLHNAWSSWWFIVSRRCGTWADAHPAFLLLKSRPSRSVWERKLSFHSVEPFSCWSYSHINAGAVGQARGGAWNLHLFFLWPGPQQDVSNILLYKRSSDRSSNDADMYRLRCILTLSEHKITCFYQLFHFCCVSGDCWSYYLSELGLLLWCSSLKKIRKKSPLTLFSCSLIAFFKELEKVTGAVLKF